MKRKSNVVLFVLVLITTFVGTFVLVGPAQSQEIETSGLSIHVDQNSMYLPVTQCTSYKFVYEYADTLEFANLQILNSKGKSLSSSFLTGNLGKNTQYPDTNKRDKTIFLCPIELQLPLKIRIEQFFKGEIEPKVEFFPFEAKFKNVTITCQKKTNKKVLKKVTGVKPACPAGYVRR